jgi:hypothetical protein
LKEKYINLLIEKKIDDAILNQKFNFILTSPTDSLIQKNIAYPVKVR